MKKQAHAQRGHSRIGASKAERWINCPKSIALEAMVPKPPSNEAAEKGTSNHEAAEYCLRRNLDAKDVIGKTFNKRFVFNQEDAVAVQIYLDHVRAVYRKYKKFGAKLYVERKFSLPEVHKDLYGTCDAIIEVPFMKIIVIDYKNGVGYVDEIDNPQLKIYGLLASYHDDYGTVELHIVQPNIKDEEPVRVFEMEHQKLLDWAVDLKAYALRTEDPNAPIAAGEWCKYCPAAPICPEKKSQAMTVAQTDFDEAPKLPSVHALSDEQVVKILEQKGQIEAWFKSVKDYALMKLANGEKIEGLKLVRGKGSRKWNDEDAIVKQYGEEILETKVMSVAKAEKVIGKKELKGLWTAYEGNITIAPESDKREALSNAKDDFDSITWEVTNDEE